MRKICFRPLPLFLVSPRSPRTGAPTAYFSSIVSFCIVGQYLVRFCLPNLDPASWFIGHETSWNNRCRKLARAGKNRLGEDQDLDRFYSSHTAVEFLAAFRAKRDLDILPNLDKIMEGRGRIAAATGRAAPTGEAKKMVHRGAAGIDPSLVGFKNNRSLSHSKNGRRLLPSGYFSLESLFLLTCLLASLLILPLVLPPLPPPPFMLLLLPMGILGMLMLLVFMPSEVRDLTRSDM